MRRFAFSLRAVACLGLLSVALAASGCDALTHKGHSAKDVFVDPKAVALVKAAARGNVERMRALVKEGVDINYAGKDGMTPLVWVMANDDRSAARELLELGADPNKKIANGNSPVWLAAGRGDPKMLELILQYHGDPNIVGWRDTTAVGSAIMTGQTQNINILVRHGANVNAVENCAHGLCESAPTWALAVGRFDIVAQLLNLGYSRDLGRLAMRVQGVRVPENSAQQQWKDRVLKMLKARDVELPGKP